MSGRIFISYRRENNSGHSGRIYDRLASEFGEGLLFMDVDSIPLGADFVKVLQQEVSSCAVLLAIIGPNWVDACDKSGRRRLDDPSDFVRVEISTALERDILVIPILLDSTSIPEKDLLPDGLKDLSRRNGLRVRHESFQTDLEKLTEFLHDRLGSSQASASPKNVGAANDPMTAAHNSPDMKSIRIVIAGHTNAGKTTLIRTLVHRPVGKVSHQANTTKDQEPVEHRDLQATFIDTPGFQAASLYLDHLMKDKQKLPPEDERLKYDVLAASAITNGDVVVYVADLNVAPEGAHEDELAIIAKCQSRIVAVMNKGRPDGRRPRKGESVVDRREEWLKLFSAVGISAVVDLDAHFDKRDTIAALYREVRELLPQDLQLIFDDGLKRFEKRQAAILAGIRKACFARYQKAQMLNESTTASARADVEKLLGKKLSGISKSLIKDISSIVEVAAKHPGLSEAKLEVLLVDETGVWDGMKKVTGGAIAGGTIGATIGAAIGAIAAALATGGLGAPAGGMLGAQWGAGIVAALGAIGGGTSESDTRTAYVSEKGLEVMLKSWISVAWGLLNHGYGKSDKVADENITDWLQQGVVLKDINPPQNYFLLAHDENDFDVFFSSAIKALDNSSRVRIENRSVRNKMRGPKERRAKSGDRSRTGMAKEYEK